MIEPPILISLKQPHSDNTEKQDNDCTQAQSLNPSMVQHSRLNDQINLLRVDALSRGESGGWFFLAGGFRPANNNNNGPPMARISTFVTAR